MKRKRTRKQKIIRIFLIIAACALVLIIAGATVYNHIQDTLRILQPQENGDSMIDWESEVARNFDKNIINFALLGFDRTASRDDEYGSGAYRPDTIMVLSINFESKDVSIISIQRDTYVEIYGQDGHDKINHAYGHGYRNPGVQDPHLNGIKTTVRTIQNFLGGVPIHYYVVLDMDGVVEIIDAVGGIYYDVDVTVRAHAGRGKIVVHEGFQKLDGYKFMEYLRARHMDHDFARMERQQSIMIEAFEQMKDKGKLRQFPDIYRSLQEHVDTNLSISQMGALALYGKEIDPSEIDAYTFEGSGRHDARGIWYLVVDEEKRVELIEDVFGVAVEKRPQKLLPGERVTPQEQVPPAEEESEPEVEYVPPPEPEPEPEEGELEVEENEDSPVNEEVNGDEADEDNTESGSENDYGDEEEHDPEKNDQVED